MSIIWQLARQVMVYLISLSLGIIIIIELKKNHVTHTFESNVTVGAGKV